MIEFCKATNLFILNGCFGDNVQNSKFTCKDRSNIDYCVSTMHALNIIQNFEILDFNNLFSDVHSPLSLDIKTDLAAKEHSNTRYNQRPISENIKLWDTDKSEQFERNFDPLLVREIDQKINTLQNKSIDAIKSAEIDNIVQDIGNLFQSTAEVTFGHTLSQQAKSTSTGKPWFNRECRRARNLFHYARRLYHNLKSNHTKLFLKNVSKAYKDTVKRSINLTRSTRVDKLRKLKTTNTRDYWKILNSESKKSNCKAPLNELHDFFKNINAQHSHSTESNPYDSNTYTVNEEINGPITEKEVTNAIRHLKNNKAAGVDNIRNEHIKQTSAAMTSIYTKLFNVVFDTAIIPESWTVGVIKPIYKNKGDPKKPENYRPITILSCLGKLFTLIINNRLKTFTENFQVIDSYQAGFRENYSTADNLFIIKSLIDIARSNKAKLFCCFIDFKQAFDSVWRDGLWLKLNTFNINGKCLKVIQSLYSNIKSKIVANNESSAFFPSFSGVRQGENLSPILFALYLNDLHSFLRSRNVNGITVNENSDELLVYLRLLILLYADDTVLFSNSESDFQYSLDIFETYCKDWKLNINVSKSKVIVFGNIRGRLPEFKISGHILEIVEEYKYLGIYLSKTGSFVAAKRHIAEQANKALYALLKKSKTLGLPSDLQLDLFDKTVKPILLYGAEVWGIGKLDMIERIHLKFLKYLFNLKKSTPTYMIYGELGIVPITVEIQSRVLNFWCNLTESDENPKLSSLLYKAIYIMYGKRKIKSEWLSNVEKCLNELGFSGIWQSQSCHNIIWLKKALRQKLSDQYIQKWLSLNGAASSSSSNYKLFKIDFVKSKYFELVSEYLSKRFLSYRTRNHRLPVEVGRWSGIPLHERKCNRCSSDIGDEYHYLLICPYFLSQRKQFIKPYYYTRPNVLKYKDLMNCNNKSQLNNLCRFVDIIMKADT